MISAANSSVSRRRRRARVFDRDLFAIACAAASHARYNINPSQWPAVFQLRSPRIAIFMLHPWMC